MGGRPAGTQLGDINYEVSTFGASRCTVFSLNRAVETSLPLSETPQESTEISLVKLPSTNPRMGK